MSPKRAAAAALLVLLGTQGPGTQESRAQESAALAERGAGLYEAKCSFCHNRVPEGTALGMLPGVASLSLKYDGAPSPYIQERPDLADAAVLTAFLRNGTGSMPPFRKTEITDEDIAAIAAYFRETSAD